MHVCPIIHQPLKTLGLTNVLHHAIVQEAKVERKGYMALCVGTATKVCRGSKGEWKGYKDFCVGVVSKVCWEAKGEWKGHMDLCAGVAIKVCREAN